MADSIADVIVAGVVPAINSHPQHGFRRVGEQRGWRAAGVLRKRLFQSWLAVCPHQAAVVDAGMVGPASASGFAPEGPGRFAARESHLRPRRPYHFASRAGGGHGVRHPVRSAGGCVIPARRRCYRVEGMRFHTGFAGHEWPARLRYYPALVADELQGRFPARDAVAGLAA